MDAAGKAAIYRPCTEDVTIGVADACQYGYAGVAGKKRKGRSVLYGNREGDCVTASLAVAFFY